jgi:hypothetical protein
MFREPGRPATQDLTASVAIVAAPSTLGTFVSPGVFRPAARGEVELSVTHFGLSTSHRFLVDPAENARWLWFLQFTASEEDLTTPVPGVTILVSSGYRSGWSCMTNQFGVCTIYDMLTLEEFQAVSSKDGYETTTSTQTAWPPFSPYPFSTKHVVMRRK